MNTPDNEIITKIQVKDKLYEVGIIVEEDKLESLTKTLNDVAVTIQAAFEQLSIIIMNAFETIRPTLSDAIETLKKCIDLFNPEDIVLDDIPSYNFPKLPSISSEVYLKSQFRIMNVPMIKSQNIPRRLI